MPNTTKQPTNEPTYKPKHAKQDLEILFFEFLASDLADCPETRNRMLVTYTYMRELLVAKP